MLVDWSNTAQALGCSHVYSVPGCHDMAMFKWPNSSPLSSLVDQMGKAIIGLGYVALGINGWFSL